ncbi:MAG: beta-galactosidase [Kiritimatiellales bacterium]
MAQAKKKIITDALWIGAAYYPELWPEDQLAGDLLRIKKAGLNAVRLAEFSWALLEPEEGHFEYEWLHKVLRRLEDEGIAIVLGTPSAAPPAWLNVDHPDAMILSKNGTRSSHGGRYSICKSSSEVRFYVNRIAEQMAQEFGSYSNLIAWQIDNELEPFPCYCESCREKFHSFLEEKYGSISKLNRCWNTAVWSQTYRSFSDVPLPDPERVRPRHHPSLIYAYRQFQSRMHCEFAHAQAVAIRKHSPVPITHNSLFRNLMRMDNQDLFSALDFHSVDAYFDSTEAWKYAYEYDWMRPAGDGMPYWLMETAASWNGGVEAVHPLIHRKNSVYSKMWMSFAMGGGGLFFWPLRMQWAGQEMCHGAVYYQNGMPSPSLEEIRRASEEIQKQAPMLLETVPRPSELAVHLYDRSRAAFDAEPTVPRFDAVEQQYQVYRRLMCQGVRADLVDPRRDISSYRAVYTPFCPVFPADRLESMLQYVQDGGTWVIGPLSLTRSEDLTVFRDHFFGSLEKSAGFRVLHHIPSGGRVDIQTETGTVSPGSLFCDSFELNGPGRVLAHYISGALNGQCAVAELELGQGRLVLLGTWPDARTLGQLMKRYVSSGDCGENFIRVSRVDKQTGQLRAIITFDLKTFDVKVEPVHAGAALVGKEESSS